MANMPCPTSPPRRTRFPLVACLGVLLILPTVAHAADSFPRGPGFYFGITKLVFFVLLYLGWIRLCTWVNKDVEEVNLDADRWNPIMVGAGLFGFLMFWMLPIFPLSLIVFVSACAGCSIWYVMVRNSRVKPDERLLTEDHIKMLLAKYLKLQLKGARPDDRKRPGVPVRFLGRTSKGQQDEDATRIQRAKETKGYKGALEMVYEACQRRATDIHLEPTKEEMAVRFRVDGIMHTVDPFSRTMGDAVVNIFKVLCNMDITEKRRPQDGSFSAQVEDRVIDFRVATAGSVIGEKMVMRVLDNSQQIISLKQLGMRDRTVEQIRKLVGQPHGLFLVCGPTGSGKSTTLYACLNEIDRYQQNIITVENPVEYHLENVTQIEINPKQGKTFAGELRSILRQDPDIIMIGEIRDAETAEIACQAAQTGHLVFSTLHANDTISAITRLVDLGVQPYMIASALTGILGQRLVRLLCSKCKVRYKPNPELLRKANLPADKIKFFYRPPDNHDEEAEQCLRCGGSGFFKRTGIFELLIINEKMRDHIRNGLNVSAIRQEAVKSGLRYLYEDGLRQVIEGRTSIQELLRVSK